LAGVFCSSSLNKYPLGWYCFVTDLVTTSPVFVHCLVSSGKKLPKPLVLFSPESVVFDAEMFISQCLAHHLKFTGSIFSLLCRGVNDGTVQYSISTACQANPSEGLLVKTSPEDTSGH